RALPVWDLLIDPLVPGAQRWHSGSMCGRYASFREAQALADAFDVEEITDAARELPASYNVAPTEQVRIVVDRVPKSQRPHTSSTSSPGADTTGTGSSGADTPGGGSPVTGSSGPSTSGDTPAGPAAAAAPAAPAATAATARRELHLARWGLVPPWAKDPSIGARMFNAREDSLATKRSFAPSLRARRCVVVADGYYEWLKEEVPGQAKPHRTPFYIHRTDSAQIGRASCRESRTTSESARAAEGIRDRNVTGVQTCALPICIGARMFNAREDSLATKRSFAPTLRARRCVVVADGYYEWLKEEVPGQAKPHRTPFYIHRTDSA